jgi:hypothetical protein
MATRHPNRSGLSVEQLEDRCLLSVTVTPPNLNLQSIDQGHGVFTVRISGHDSTTTALLKAPTSLTETVTSGSATVTLGMPVHTVTTGNGTLMLKFRRSDLQGLSAGSATLTVSAGSGGASETDAITLFGKNNQGHPGNSGGHGHHGHSGDNGNPGHSGDNGNHGHSGDNGGHGNGNGNGNGNG